MFEFKYLDWCNSSNELDWGDQPFDICSCGQLSRLDCEQDCLLQYRSPSGDTWNEYPLDTDDQSSIRVGTLGDFATDICQPVYVPDYLDGDCYRVEFPDLDLPNWSEQELIDTFSHPGNPDIYVSVYRWPDGQIRNLMFCK